MKFTLFLFVLVLFNYGLVHALPQAPGVTATTNTNMPTASTANGGSDTQNLRGAPCRGPPAVGQYRLSGLLTTNKK